MSDIALVGVVGAGLMGAGIAEVCARAGVQVVVCESDASASTRGEKRVADSLARAVAKGKIAAEERDEALGRITHTIDLGALGDSDLVVEAVTENESAKLPIFERVAAALTNPDAMLASNTSSIPIMKLAMVTGRPQNVIGMHFFNPVPVLDLVELVPSLVTSPQTYERAHAFATSLLGKTVIRSQDRAGFIVNSLLVPYLLAAIRMTDSGFATVDDIDNGMVLGCAHPMGPLRLADLIGLDTVGAIADAMYDEFKEPLYSAPPVLVRMVQAGLLGRKSGRGFYCYRD